MPSLFTIVSEYFWLVALGFAAFNYARARRSIATSVPSDRAMDALTLLKRFAVIGNLPWVVMAIGKILGVTPTIWSYFRPQDGNPFVVAWFAIAFAITCIYAYWVLFAGGAEKVRDLQPLAAVGRIGAQQQSLRQIKFYAGVGPFFFIAWAILVMSMNVPLVK